jgi:hypothetical protein
MSNMMGINIVIPPPMDGNILYHYTSQVAMHSIVENKTLWVSHAYYLNDANEIKYGCNLFKNIISNKINEEEPGDLKQLLIELSNHMDHIAGTAHYIFVFSLSEQGNLLSQWRGYAPFGGVSIGFNKNMLQTVAKLKDYKLIKCVYEYIDQQSILSFLLDEIITQFKIDLPSIDTKGRPEHQKYMIYLNKYTDKLLFALCHIKDPAFKEECEWRLVSRYYEYYIHEDIKYREGKSTLIPYIELKIGELALSGHGLFEYVFVGPSSNLALSLSAVGCYLSKKKACNHIINSMIPYRNV